MVCFWPLYCLFQVLLIRAMIGCGTRRGQLYFLDLTKESNKRLNQAHDGKEGEFDKMKKVWL